MNVSLSAPRMILLRNLNKQLKEQINPRLQLLQLCFPVRLQKCSVDSDLA